MQKKYSCIFAIILFLTPLVIACKDLSAKVTSKTYFSVRTPFQFGSPEQLSFTRDLSYLRENGYGAGFRATIFGGQSTDTHNLGIYFMPFGQPCVAVNGTIEENGTDLLPQNFNLFSVKYSDEVAVFLPGNVQNINSAFQSTISIKPKQSVIGLGLGYQQAYTINEYTIWFLLSTPILHVRNSMNLSECITSTGDFYDVQPITDEITNLNQNLKNMTCALVQDDWCFGKIDCKTRTKTRLAFVELLFGIQWFNHEKCALDSYIGLTIPTGNKPKAEYVFEPIVGNGGHFGIIWGTAAGFDLYHNEADNFALKLETNITMQYLFEKKQKRSIDLKYKPWSRYLELYKDKAQAIQANDLQATSIQSFFLATPGINTLTQDVKVIPGFNLSLNIAFILIQNESERGFTGELGYNFYAKETEKVSLDCNNLGTVAIKDHSGRGITNPARNITNDLLTNEASVANISFHAKTNNDILADYDNRLLTTADLDLNSAAHPCVLSHTIYITCGYHWTDIEYPILTGLGVSYEFENHMNTALNRWMLWGTIGLSF